MAHQHTVCVGTHTHAHARALVLVSHINYHPDGHLAVNPRSIYVHSCVTDYHTDLDQRLLLLDLRHSTANETRSYNE